MMHIDLLFNRVNADRRHLLSLNSAREQAMYDADIASADEFIRLHGAVEVLVSYTTVPFDDRCCPVCGSFACEGC